MMSAIEDLAQYIYARMPSETPEEARTTWDDLTEQQRDIYRAHARNAAVTFPDQHPDAAAEAQGQTKRHAADDVTARARAEYERRWATPGPDYPEPVPTGVVELGDWASEYLPELLAEVERWQFRCGQAVVNGQLREAERDELRAEVERLRGALDGLVTRWAEELAEDNTNGYGAGVEHCLDDLRELLRGDQ